jgi:hypothetical protein
MSVEKEELQLGLKFPELSNLGNDAARGKWLGIPKILIAFWIHRCWSWLHKAIGCIETHTKPNTTEQSNPMWQLHSSTTVPKKGKRDKLPLWTLISEEICASKLTTQGSSWQDVVGKVVWVVTSTPPPPADELSNMSLKALWSQNQCHIHTKSPTKPFPDGTCRL